MTECPKCNTERSGETFVLGHVYCPECDIRFVEGTGEYIGDGRV